MPSQVTELEGKAWWTQLQYDRAIEAGCQFYIQRPATTDGRNKQLVETQPVPNAPTRPSTVPTTHSTTHGKHTGAWKGSQHLGCELACAGSTPSSAKLPARKAVSRQLINDQISSTLGSSCRVPASRGNDWSPVHSRPGTRSQAIPHQQSAKLHADSQSIRTSVARLLSPDCKAAQHCAKQGQLLTAAADVHSSVPVVVMAPAIITNCAGAPVPCSPQAVAPSASTTSSQVPAASSTHPSTETSAASSALAQPASTQTSTASLTLSANLSSEATQGRAGLEHVAKNAIAARFAAWAPMTEEAFAHYTPHFLAGQEEAEWQRQHAIACKGCHYKLPVPIDQGQKRVAVHYIMREAHRFHKAAQQKSAKPTDSSGTQQKASTAFLKAFSVLSIAQGAAAAKERREPGAIQQQHSLPVPVNTAFPAVSRAASLKKPQPQAPFLRDVPKQPSTQPSFKQSQLPQPHRAAADIRSGLSRCPSSPPVLLSPRPKGTSLARRAVTAAHRARGKGQQDTVTMPVNRQQADAVQADSGSVDSSAADVAAETAKLADLGSSLKKAESGSLDSHLQIRPPTAPHQRWQAVADAAGFDLASGMHAEVIQQPLALLPNKLADSFAAVHSQQDLQLKELLSFAQDDLTTSAESSPAASPRPVSRAVDVVPKLQARTAVSSPGVSVRPTPRMNNAEVVQGLLDPARFNHNIQLESCVGQRLAQLTAKRTTESKDTGQHRADETKGAFGNSCIQAPIWQEHLFREGVLAEQMEQARVLAVQSSPLYHPLLV